MSCRFDYTFSKSIQLSNESQSEQLKLSKICLTKTCNDTASEILKNLDPTANPCDNFYQFACGGYIKTAIIPNDREDIDIVEQKNENVMNQLEMSLNETIKEDEPRPLKMLKNYFQSCVNETAIEENSVESLLQIIKSVGGWPLIEREKWNESNFDWIECITELQKMGFSIDNMPKLRIENDKTDSAKRTIFMELDRSSIIYRRRANNKTKDFIRENIVNITVQLGANRIFADEVAQELFSFVSTLYRFQDNETKIENRYLGKFKTLKNSPDGFPIKKYIEKLVLPFSNIEDDTDVFWCDSIDKLKILMNNTSKSVQANYIIWNVIAQSLESLKKDIREKYGKTEFERKPISRTEKCIEILKNSMPFSLQALYIRNYLDRNTKDDTIEIVENIRKQILKNIDETTNTMIKDIFHNKTKDVRLLIAYVGDVFNDTELEEFDKDFNISSSNDYLRNNINLIGSVKRKDSFDLQTRVEKFLLPHITSFFQWNLAFAPNLNIIEMSPISLQGNTNKFGNPKYIKYGATGFLLGHEMYHGIDSKNRERDEKLQKISWDNNSREIFFKQDQCLIEQYGNYSFGGEKLDGRQFLKENTADNGGIKATYLAYSNWASKTDEPELLLPNLPYTPKQLFWISAVNSFCLKERNPNSYYFDYVHVPPKLRFLGAFSNMPEFAKDFNCPVESQMNPSNRCSVI